MLEYVIGVLLLLLVLIGGIEGYISRSRISNELRKEGQLVKENLSHLAGAIISLSEILDDAEDVIENISQVPTVGEIIQQALMGFISQKMQDVLPDPIIAPMEGVISDYVTPRIVSDGPKTKKSEEEINTDEV
jgi:hypothetical protein